ncbi:MAG: hypothetical protein JWR11_5649 [Mycobacterium sp.]|nr:hypothetical protein [Mycobacterium sp.]MDT5070240.1 hypothetical protein [Mycobacterium sp.]
MINELPDPVLTQIYSLKAVTGPTLDYGDSPSGRRRLVPLVGGMFTGPEIRGNLLPGGSASWQIDLPDGAAAVEMRYTLQTDRGALLYVRSNGVGHGNADPGQHLVHAATHIETSAPNLDWLNNSVLVTVAGRTTVNILYETYLVD